MVQEIRETEPISPIGCQLPKAIQLRLGDTADLPNTEKQTQSGSQNGETNNMSQMKDPEKSPEKELNKMEARLPDTEFKTMVIRTSKNLELQQHKKGQKGIIQ